MKALPATFVAMGSFVALLSVQTAHVNASIGLQEPSTKEGLPDGPGKAVVERICTTCHPADYIAPSARTVPVWRDTLELMKGNGAVATDEEWATITSYIMITLAHLNVNTAPAEDIGLVFGVDQKTAARVVAFREKQGAFQTTDDLKKVPDIDAARIEALKPRLIFDPN